MPQNRKSSTNVLVNRELNMIARKINLYFEDNMTSYILNNSNNNNIHYYYYYNIFQL